MKCLARTKNGYKCSRSCKFVFCKQHSQLWYKIISYFVLTILAGILILLQISDYFPKESNEKIFAPLFKKNDSTCLNILITKFENYVSKEDTYCIGRSIEEHINYLKSNKKITSPVNVVYADSIAPVKNTRDAVRIQKMHNSDLLIYGLVQNIITDCKSADINLRHNINKDILPKELDKVEISVSKHDLNFIKTTPYEIQRGTLLIDRYSISNWLKILVAVKNKNFKNLKINLNQILLDSTLNDIEKRKRLYPLGDLYFNVKKFDEAIQVYKEIVKIKPTARAYEGLGATYTKKGNFELAEDYFKKAVIISPEYKKLYVTWGNMFYFKKEYTKAINKYKLRLEIDSTKSFVYDNIGLAYFRLKNYDKALQFYNFGLKRDSLDASIYSGIGHVYKKQNLNIKAIEYYTKAINHDSTSFLPYSHRGYVNLRIGEYKKAIKDLTKYVLVNPTEFEDYANRASAFKSLKMYKEAFKDCERSILLEPNQIVSYSILGDIYYKKKNYGKSIQNYTKLIDIDSTYSNIYYDRGWSYLNNKNYKKAIYDFNKLILKDSISSKTYNSIGIALELSKQYEEALINYNKALEINPNSSNYNHNKGNLYFKIGEHEKAVKYMRVAVSLNSKKLHYNFDLYHFICWKYWYISIPVLLIIILLTFKKIFIYIRKKFYSKNVSK